MFTGLDHLAIVVSDTEEALKLWRDQLRLPLLYSEVVAQGTLRLTHLDLGNTQLQLVEPLVENHPLRTWLDQNGPGLHHFCFGVEDVGAALAQLPEYGLTAGEAAPHQGTRGRRALWVDPASTSGIRVELTGE
ncbi:MAG: VOC family protein [Armatimonadetes bacterium]|nr:VOC family protein [Armatimonadota bacterium]